MIDPLHDRPIVAALAGALAISFSGILFRVAHVSPSTGAVLRCLYALPILWPLAWLEQRRYGPRPLKQRALAWLAGVFFAVDLIAWHEGIEQVGAGLATVLGNLQVVLVGVLAWLILRERVTKAELERRAGRARGKLRLLLPLFAARLAPVRAHGSPLTDDRAPVEWLTDRMIIHEVERGGAHDEPALPTAPGR